MATEAFVKEGEGVPDLILLDQLDENAVFANLKLRLEKGLIFTYIGGVVVSCNPYKQLDLCSEKHIKSYQGRYMYEMPPHAYALADDTFRSMLRNKTNQTVIISGESGAGKTEASKIVMRFIAAVSGGKERADQIKNELLASNPILEAFGNAKTQRNDNSSRFGKYMEIIFDYSGAPQGGKITNYLLEKSRVVTRANDERAFHIFYNILKCGDNGLLQQLKLQADPSQYTYLALSNCYAVSTINDKEDFAIVKNSMVRLGFTAEQQLSIWQMCAAVLHLGNVKFSPNPQKADESRIDNPETVRTVCELLSVNPAVFGKALTCRSITTGPGKKSSKINVPLTVDQANFARDATAKSIYGKLFTHIVDVLNERLKSQSREDTLQIGLLDIYGFEIFGKNSFEQFCINLVNEKLQQVFIELTLKAEQEEYQREGIQWTPIKYFDNKTICDLIEKKPIGIISLLDECCIMSNSSDAKFLEKLNNAFANHAHYLDYQSSKDKSIGQSEFRLRHYAGDVTYDTTGFLDKNKDTLFNDLVNCLADSSNPVLNKLFQRVDDNKKRPPTAGFQFRQSVNELITALLECEAHYIRCIKSNEQKRALFVEEERFRHQIRYLGLVENVRVRRAGFAFRQPYDRFLRRYKMLSSETWPSWSGNDKDGVAALFRAQQIGAGEFQLGHTKVFIKNPQTLFHFEKARSDRLPAIVMRMQAVYRGWKVRSEWRQRRAAIVLQLVWRTFKARNWVATLASTYANAAAEQGVWGGNTQWPQAPSVLQRASDLSRNVLESWRTKLIVESMDAAHQGVLRQKVLAMETFEGKKQWDPTRKWEADYLEKSTNPRAAAYVAGMQHLFQRYNDQSVAFSDYANKINPKGKTQLRAIVVTDLNVYKENPKNYKVLKVGTPLAQVQELLLSTKRDQFVVLVCTAPVRDMLLDFGVGGGEKVSEFVIAVLQQCYRQTGRMPAVRFADQHQFNNTRTAKKDTPATALVFESSPKVKAAKYVKGKVLVP